MFGFHRHHHGPHHDPYHGKVHHGHPDSGRHGRGRHHGIREREEFQPGEFIYGRDREASGGTASALSVCTLCEKHCSLDAPGCGKGKRMAMQNGLHQKETRDE